jgi:glycosyltransferase involved in cell wall biosynthesis
MIPPLVSVIVPAYQAAHYLPRCLDAILAQTHPALEILLVDDGSEDDTPAVCDRFSARDGRVKVIRQSHRGVSAARNAGLDRATGKYLCFVDADDTVSPAMLARLIQAAEETGAALVQCESDYHPALARVNGLGIPPQQESFGAFFLRCFAGHAWDPVWGKLMLRSAIVKAGLRFDDLERVGFEDTLFVWCLLGVLPPPVFLAETHYFHTERPDSLSQERRRGLVREMAALLAALERFARDQFPAAHRYSLRKVFPAAAFSAVLDEYRYTLRPDYQDRREAAAAQLRELRGTPFGRRMLWRCCAGRSMARLGKVRRLPLHTRVAWRILAFACLLGRPGKWLRFV